MVENQDYLNQRGSGKIKVFLDEHLLAEMPDNRVMTVKLGLGLHVFATNDPKWKVELEAGEEYYQRVYHRGGFLWRKGKTYAEFVTIEDGSLETMNAGAMDTVIVPGPR